MSAGRILRRKQRAKRPKLPKLTKAELVVRIKDLLGDVPPGKKIHTTSTRDKYPEYVLWARKHGHRVASFVEFVQGLKDDGWRVVAELPDGTDHFLAKVE